MKPRGVAVEEEGGGGGEGCIWEGKGVRTGGGGGVRIWGETGGWGVQGDRRVEACVGAAGAGRNEGERERGGSGNVQKEREGCAGVRGKRE